MSPNRSGRMQGSLLALAGLALASLSGCAFASPDDGEEHVAAAQQREIDSGTLVWCRYLLKQNSGTGPLVGVVYAMNQTAGSFTAGNEYWYLNRGLLAELSSTSLYIIAADGTGTPTAPGFSNMQSFTLPVNPAGGWGSGWTTDPLATQGKLYVDGALALRLVLTGSGASTSVSEVAWYQVLPSSGTAANIRPGGAFAFTTGGVEVGSGKLGYDIAQTP